MTKQNYLKTEKFQDLATEVSKVNTDIQLIRSTIEMFPSMDRMGEGELVMHYYKIHQYHSVLFSKLQDLEEELNEISGTLYSVTELNDLREYVADADINFPDNK